MGTTPHDGSRKRIKCGGCPHVESKSVLTTMRDAALAHPVDIEELGQMGRAMNGCAYYAARSAVPAAQVVVVPYQSVLHRATRESLGIQLEGNVFVFDEGHNDID